MNQFQRNNNQNQTIENWQVYSAVGRIKTNTITRGSETYVEEYKYDLRGRLEKVLKDGVEQVGYTFDNNSNRLTEARGGNTISGVYDAQDRLKTYGDLTFSYTDNGDVKTKVHSGGTDTYHYDAFGNMTQVDLAHGRVLTYKMDARDRRVAKLVDGVVVQRMVYKDQLNPVAILDSENNVETLFVYGSKSNVPNYMIKGGEKYKYITDHKGSVLQVIKMSDGSVAQDISYDFWGNVLSDTSPGFQPFYYVGGLYDVDTKLIKFGVRSYDPEVGRWMQKEPLGFAGALNFYAYCEGEPVNWVDVNGLITVVAISRDYSVGTHAGLYVGNMLDKNLVYDPNGGFSKKYKETRSGIIDDENADYYKYIDYQIKTAGDVELFIIDTTPEMEVALIKAIYNQQLKPITGAVGFYTGQYCSDHTSMVLNAIFKEIRANTFCPGNLADDLDEIKSLHMVCDSKACSKPTTWDWIRY